MLQTPFVMRMAGTMMLGAYLVFSGLSGVTSYQSQPKMAYVTEQKGNVYYGVLEGDSFVAKVDTKENKIKINFKRDGQKAEITYERDASNEISDFDRKVIDKIITAIEKFEEKKPGPTEKVLTFMRQIKKAFRAFSSTLKG